ncbi:hypothetical protein [Paraburkholderia dinghuensis]|uniref:hypothetical protein n=1 Tax=Paraburkholderia dinghuensis TaxID=2305225 RepID=UPI001623AEF4|nr:hypothetical protein [Paraburkholderia dinghuensis]
MNIRRYIRVATLCIGISLFAGCAHNITIAPDAASLTPAKKPDQISATVGLVVTNAMRTQEIVTPGGGGDKVAYKPYRDLEFPVYLALSQTFKDVVKLDEAPTEAAARAKGLTYVITPEITTTSSSPSIVTWPPTDFRVTLTCTVADPSGKVIAKPQVTGSGHAEFNEFKHNFGLSADRATIEAVRKLPDAIGQALGTSTAQSGIGAQQATH